MTLDVEVLVEGFYAETVEAQIVDLPGLLLGLASENLGVIWIDVDAAGIGWSVLNPRGGFDLVSVVAHEFGHILGLADVDDRTNVMGAFLAPGISRLGDEPIPAAQPSKGALPANNPVEGAAFWLDIAPLPVENTEPAAIEVLWQAGPILPPEKKLDFVNLVSGGELLEPPPVDAGPVTPENHELDNLFSELDQRLIDSLFSL